MLFANSFSHEKDSISSNKNSTIYLNFIQVILLAISFCAISSNSLALELDPNNGWSGSLDTTLSFGASYRAQEPDNSLYSAASGARAELNKIGFRSTNTDSGNVNYSKGDAFANLLKATIDYSLRKDDMGLFTRIRAWTDFALEGDGVNQGNGGSNYAQGQPLSDNGFAHLSKFSGATILDAYVYNTFDVSGYPMQLRLGNQVINWGESLFVQGINQINPIDLNALRKPGVEVRDAFLPVKSLSMNLGLGGGKSLEAFYQFEWSPANIDSCGTYWSPVEFQITTSAGQPCSSTISTLPGLNNPVSLANGLSVPMSEGKDGPDSDQFGVALRLPVEKLDGEPGF